MTPALGKLLTRIQPAGVILFRRNIMSAEQTWALLRDCQRHVTTPLFTCVDMEGGSVDRLRDVFGPSPSAASVFETADRDLFRLHGKAIGAICRALGFNVDFAPTLDLALPPSLPVMTSRGSVRESARSGSVCASILAGAVRFASSRLRQALPRLR